ncbi:MAG: M48 family metallopeptidase [Wenzhouxiangella sp.]
MPTYSLRTHPRARHVRLRVEPCGSVVVTAPRGIGRDRIDRLVADRAGWIEQVRRRIAAERAQRDPAVCARRPERIELPAVGETWPVRYRPGRQETASLRQSQAGLVLTLPDREAHRVDDQVAACLVRWLRARARWALVPWVEALAVEHGIEYGRISIRNQRSRWGSCSAVGNLSLNARLLLCSAETCRYVLIHELVHIEHPNHSPAFWRRVGELAPGYRSAMVELEQLSRRLPDWLG